MTQPAALTNNMSNERTIYTADYGDVTLRILKYRSWAGNAVFVYLQLPGDIVELSARFNVIAKGEYYMEPAICAGMGGSDFAQLMITKKGAKAAGLNPDLKDHLYAIADLATIALFPG